MQDVRYQKPVNWQGDQNNVILRKIIATLIAFWPRFVGCVIVSLLAAFLYLRYTVPLYNIRAKILIQDDKSGANYESLLFNELGTTPKSKSVDNEIEILKSRAIMSAVVKDLQLNVHYYTQGHIKTAEVYEGMPFSFTLSPAEAPVDKKFSCRLRATPAGFELHSQTHTWTGRWNDTILLPAGKAVFTKTGNFPLWQKDDDYLINVSGNAEATSRYMSIINFTVPNKQVSAIILTLKESIPERGERILNKFINVYLKANVDDKNRIADSTISFIDERLSLVGRELSGVEQQIEDFKKTNNLTDVAQEASLLVNNNNSVNAQVSQQEVQLSVINYLEQYLRGSGNKDRVVPSSLIVQDPTFSSLVQRYNELQLSRERMLMSNTESNPLVRNINQQLDNIREDLVNSLPAAKRNIEAGIRALKEQTGSLDRQIKNVPARQRVYLEFSRQQAIKQDLYLFLLKKREDMAISKSSTLADARIIDPPASDDAPFFPNRSQVLLTALFIGLLLPGISIYLEGLFNNRVSLKADVINNTKAPVIGEIGHSMEAKGLVVQTGTRNILSEQFRALRTNLQFLLPGKNEKVVLLTSGRSGEGKSFIAINLAGTLAISNKKVLLVELDLRKPGVSKLLGLGGAKGFSDYAIGNARLDEIITPSGLDDHLFVLPSGTLPPNPTELIMLPQVELLFNTLRQQFDYIIVDTPPIGLVTDAQLLSVFSDATLFIVRQNYTYKQQLALIEEIYLSGRMPRFSVIVNDIKTRRGAGYGYPYAHGYGGYGNEYFAEQQKNGVRNIMGKRKHVQDSRNN